MFSPDASRRLLLRRAVNRQFRTVLTLAAAVWVPLAGVVPGGVAQTFDTVCRERRAPVVTTRASALAIDDRPSFIVFVSYFDAMRADVPFLERDFAFLKSRGVGGIRVFPLWIRDAGTGSSQRAGDTLLDAEGRVRSEERWQRFTTILNRAGRCGLVVDVTFNREMLDATARPTLSVARYERGIVEVARRLSSARVHHVLIDLQNEHDKTDPGQHLSDDEVRALRNAVKHVDPDAILMASSISIDEGVRVTERARLDVVAFHEPQRPGWYRATADRVKALLTIGRPVYLQEMARAPDRGIPCEPQGDGNPIRAALEAAKNAGAAAWTFHTSAGFRLDAHPFLPTLRSCPTEIDFLEQLRAGSREPREP